MYIGRVEVLGSASRYGVVDEDIQHVLPNSLAVDEVGEAPRATWSSALTERATAWIWSCGSAANREHVATLGARLSRAGQDIRP